MAGLFGLLLVFSFLALFLGLLNPEISLFWITSEHRTRANVVVIYSGVMVVCLICVIVFSTSDKPSPLSATSPLAANPQSSVSVAITQQITPKQIAEKAIAKLRMRPTWEKIEIDTAEKNSYTLSVWYRAMPSGPSEVERDTKEVARAILAAVVASGGNPSKDEMSVYVHAYRSEHGETGKDLVRVFGKTKYNPFTDQLIFVKAK